MKIITIIPVISVVVLLSCSKQTTPVKHEFNVTKNCEYNGWTKLPYSDSIYKFLDTTVTKLWQFADRQHSTYDTIIFEPFKDYGDKYLKNHEDSCLIIKTHPHHDGTCYAVGYEVYDSCGRYVAGGCTDSKVLDTNYNRCLPCDSIYYKYMFKEYNVKEYFKHSIHN